MQPAQERVVGAEIAGQRLHQLRDLRAHPAFGQLGQRDGVVLARDQRGQHRPSRDPEDVGGHRRQLDPGVLQFLLQPLRLPGALGGQRGPVAGQVPQLPDRLRRHERGPQQPALTHLTQPRGVADVRFATGQTLGVRGVDQDHVQVVLQQVERATPVVAGRLEHHQGDLFGDQPVPQLEQRIGGGRIGADLLAARPPALRTRRPHARLQLLLADIQRGAPLVQQFHRNPSGHKRTQPKRARPEEPQGSEESDPRAHRNNRQLLSVAPNPMLTDELTASRKLRGPGRTRAHFPASTAAQRSGPGC